MSEVVVTHGKIPLKGAMDVLNIHEGDILSLNVAGDLIMISKKDEKVWDESRDFLPENFNNILSKIRKNSGERLKKMNVV